MRNLKKALILSSMVLSGAASASPELCGFDGLPGDLIEFTASDKPRSTDAIKSQLPSYRYFTSDQAGDILLDKKVYVGRKAVFDFTKSVTRTKTLSGGDDTEVTHVFTGVADNCQKVFLQINEADFPRYFDNDNVFYPNEFNFYREESTLGILLHASEVYDNVDSPDIAPGTYYVKRGMPFPMMFVDKHYQETVVVPPYSEVQVHGIQYIPFAAKGETKTDTRIKASYAGKEGYLSGYREYLSLTHPLEGVPSQYVDAIKSHKLVFGMGVEHIIMSLGLPEHTQVFNVYQTPIGYKVDYESELGSRYGKPIGQVMHLIYSHIPYELTIDMTGKFRQGRQVFGQPKFKGTLDFMAWQ